MKQPECKRKWAICLWMPYGASFTNIGFWRLGFGANILSIIFLGDTNTHPGHIQWRLAMPWWKWWHGWVTTSHRCKWIPWWRHQMETFSALLALCAGNSPVIGEFPSQRPVTRSSDIFFDLRLNKRLNNLEAVDLRRHRAHYDVRVLHLCSVVLIDLM